MSVVGFLERKSGLYLCKTWPFDKYGLLGADMMIRLVVRSYKLDL